MTALEKAGVDKEEIDMFITHQANNRIIQSIAKKWVFPKTICM